MKPEEFEIALQNEFLHFMYRANRDIPKSEIAKVPANVLREFFLGGGRAGIQILLREAQKDAIQPQSVG